MRRSSSAHIMSRKVDRFVKSFGRKSSSFTDLGDAEGELPFLQEDGNVKSKKPTKGNALPSDIKPGYLAVYVGEEKKRYVISAKYLNHALFRALLKKSEEEYGFEHPGGLEVACEPPLFDNMLEVIRSNHPASRNIHFEDLGQY